MNVEIDDGRILICNRSKKSPTLEETWLMRGSRYTNLGCNR